MKVTVKSKLASINLYLMLVPILSNKEIKKSFVGDKY